MIALDLRPLTLREMFIEIACARLDELHILKLKTESAIGLSYSVYWTRKHKETMRDLEHAEKINKMILRELKFKRKML